MLEVRQILIYRATDDKWYVRISYQGTATAMKHSSAFPNRFRALSWLSNHPEFVNNEKGSHV